MPAPPAESPIPLVTLKRRVRDEKHGQVKDLYEEIGRLPAGKFHQVRDWHRPFYIAGAPERPIAMMPTGSVHSKILNETIELEPQTINRHRDKFLSLTVEWTDQWQRFLLLHGDPIAAIMIRDFEPCCDWLIALDRRQKCPFCRGHAAVACEKPLRRGELYLVSFVCVRRDCRFVKSWEFADRK